MYLQIGEKEFELSTNLGTVKAIEGKLRMPLMNAFEKIGEATVDEMIELLSFGLGGKKKAEDAGLIEAIENDMDYATIWEVLQEYIVSMMYSGTPEQKEAKIAKSNFDEPQKNAFRRMLGLQTKDSEVPPISTPES